MAGVCRLCGQKVEGFPVLPGRFEDMIWSEDGVRVHWFKQPRRKSLTEQLNPLNGYESAQVEPSLPSEVETVESPLALGLAGTSVAYTGFGLPIPALD